LLDEVAPSIESIAREHGAKPLALPPDVDPWRDIRHYATRAIEALDREAATVRADLAVPISALPELARAAAAVAASTGRRVFIFGHAGIGILHVLIPARRADPAEWQAAEAAKDEVVDTAIRLRGAVSGEHGMGLGNRRYAARAFGTGLELMKQIKAVFDPKGILNPGKIWE